MTQQRISLVTGANRGIGKEVARQLAQKGDTVLLSARRISSAQEAVNSLNMKNLVPVQLDVTDANSVDALKNRIESEYGYLDVLINNAAIHYDTWQRVTNADLNTVQEAVDTNLYGPWRLIQAMHPLLRKSDQARIVNVSSGAGALDSLGSGTPAYSITKLGLNGLTMMFASALKSDGILVNAVCPGWVATDMGGSGGRPVAEGAKGIVWATHLPKNSPTGAFFRDSKRIEW